VTSPFEESALGKKGKKTGLPLMIRMPSGKKREGRAKRAEKKKRRVRVCLREEKLALSAGSISACRHDMAKKGRQRLHILLVGRKGLHRTGGFVFGKEGGKTSGLG